MSVVASCYFIPDGVLNSTSRHWNDGAGHCLEKHMLIEDLYKTPNSPPRNPVLGVSQCWVSRGVRSNTVLGVTWCWVLLGVGCWGCHAVLGITRCLVSRRIG